jgi:hypothetical protein
VIYCVASIDFEAIIALNFARLQLKVFFFSNMICFISSDSIFALYRGSSLGFRAIKALDFASVQPKLFVVFSSMICLISSDYCCFY